MSCHSQSCVAKQAMTHPRIHAARNPDHAAIIMADSGETLTYGQMERQANQGAHLLQLLGIKAGDTIAVWLPNLPDYLCIYWAAQRAGLYITPIATGLTAHEAAYILANSGSKLLISCTKIAGLEPFLRDHCPENLLHYFDLSEWTRAIASLPSSPIKNESAGFHLVQRHDGSAKGHTSAVNRRRSHRAPCVGTTVTRKLWRGARYDLSLARPPLSHSTHCLLHIMPPPWRDSCDHAEV
jgi:acyl-CoA synthetase (AMP-forming)/AMP-acid ligase II